MGITQHQNGLCPDIMSEVWNSLFYFLKWNFQNIILWEVTPKYNENLIWRPHWLYFLILLLIFKFSYLIQFKSILLWYKLTFQAFLCWCGVLVKKEGSPLLFFQARLVVSCWAGILLLIGTVWRCLPRILHPTRHYAITGFFPNVLLKLLNPERSELALTSAVALTFRAAEEHASQKQYQDNIWASGLQVCSSHPILPTHAFH